MFLTAPMRFFTSRCDCGMYPVQAPGSRRLRLILLVALALVPTLAGPRAARNLIAVFERVALLVQVEAEVLGEARNRLLDRLLGLVAPVAPGDLPQQLGL